MKKGSGKTARRQVPRRPPSGKRTSVPASAVFLVGFMGAGKTSVGRALGQRLNWVFEDLDDRIEAREGRTVAEIFRDSGELEFRRAEHAALEQVLDELQSGVTMIVALGGGTFAQDRNHKAIEDSGIPTVFLDAPLQELWQRCSLQVDANRPLLTSKNSFWEKHEARLRYYKTATRKIDTAGKKVDTVAAEIADILDLKKIELRTEQGEVE